jgi:hypothetical protein
MLRKVGFQVVCGLMVLCFLAPAVSRAQDVPAKAPVPAESGLTPVLPPALTSGVAASPAANPNLVLPLQHVRLASCSDACSIAVGCLQLCGEGSRCVILPHQVWGKCQIE